MGDPARCNEIAQGACGLGGRHSVVRPVHLVQIDVIDTHRAQAGIHAAPEPVGTAIADQARTRLAKTTFGRDDDLVSLSRQFVSQSSTEDLL